MSVQNKDHIHFSYDAFKDAYLMQSKAPKAIYTNARGILITKVGLHSITDKGFLYITEAVSVTDPILVSLPLKSGSTEVISIPKLKGVDRVSVDLEHRTLNFIRGSDGWLDMVIPDITITSGALAQQFHATAKNYLETFNTDGMFKYEYTTARTTVNNLKLIGLIGDLYKGDKAELMQGRSEVLEQRSPILVHFTRGDIAFKKNFNNRIYPELIDAYTETRAILALAPLRE